DYYCQVWDSNTKKVLF
nr:immunoglobulin light chain junction region [Macaca mulatta]MOX79565.1 immunoglobulin light chain junction region [Macaca mulatta]MOX79613.1 immunoglobulin light chain junction region [Macaca mulatta]MOX79804.1 immunoglobulin light chain junction region [Macaca mulatta]MOX80859.1 immunoglobulin light chain junction region [Macaca mulatta]